MPTRPNPNLTLYQTNVMVLIARGYSYDEIAAELGTSRASIGTTLKHVRKKLGAKNAAHAVAIAIKQKKI